MKNRPIRIPEKQSTLTGKFSRSQNEALDFQRLHAAVLLGLLALFIFRVVAQFIQLVQPVGFLPEYDRWASGALPYEMLLTLQLAIITGFACIIRYPLQVRIEPSKRWGMTLYACGLIYFFAMFFRLTFGVIFESAPQWFSYSIPAFFHLVLASFLLVIA
ncbi:MAG: hypothetical protein AAF546_12285, partial [Verrucomicrobiota bacterium]